MKTDILLDAAKKAAIAAGEVVNAYRSTSLDVVTKLQNVSLASQVVTEADLASQKVILEIIDPIAREFDHAVLAEETEDNQERFVKDYFWCIDPLDGTLPFSEGKDGYSIAIALVRNNGVVELGVVYQPWSGDLYWAVKGKGAFKNGQLLHTPTGDADHILRLYSDRGFDTHSDFANLFSYYSAHFPDNEIIYKGGAVTHALTALEDPYGIYYKLPKKQKGGGSLWDYAATSCIMLEAGGYAGDAKGNILELNKKDSLFMNDSGILFTSNKFIFEYMKQYLP